MGSVNISYQTIKGYPEHKTLEGVTELYQELFEDADLEFFEHRLNEKEDILTIAAYEGAVLIAFKIGYRYDLQTFYSWVGGVLPKYRRLGIASELAKIQEDYIKQKGYSKLRTKSMNKFKAMMALNLKRGFDIISVYTNQSGQTKIVFEKNIS